MQKRDGPDVKYYMLVTNKSPYEQRARVFIRRESRKGEGCQGYS